MRKVLYIFGELNDKDIDWMIQTGRRRAVAQETVLIQEGQSIDTFFIVLDGLFSVRAAGVNNEEIARLGAGEILGEISFVDTRPPSATVRALLPCLVLAIPRERLAARLQQDIGFAARFYRAVAIFLAHRVRLLTDRKAPAAEELAESSDQLDANLLDTVFLAGARFDRMLKQTMAS